MIEHAFRLAANPRAYLLGSDLDYLMQVTLLASAGAHRSIFLVSAKNRPALIERLRPIHPNVRGWGKDLTLEGARHDPLCLVLSYAEFRTKALLLAPVDTLVLTEVAHVANPRSGASVAVLRASRTSYRVILVGGEFPKDPPSMHTYLRMLMPVRTLGPRFDFEDKYGVPERSITVRGRQMYTRWAFKDKAPRWLMRDYGTYLLEMTSEPGEIAAVASASENLTPTTGQSLQSSGDSLQTVRS